ncbi:hypothetical protein I79_010010 [Cricetulus griseus]|uniref:Uncharacterized protein n=1 Tax=Cricetulus griseus TaxID=10029 RepID=G3HHB2_CRIGR|nr:hypothetical protein I79_010010 [Cricetulus griseus]
MSVEIVDEHQQAQLLISWGRKIGSDIIIDIIIAIIGRYLGHCYYKNIIHRKQFKHCLKSY